MIFDGKLKMTMTFNGKRWNATEKHHGILGMWAEDKPDDWARLQCMMLFGTILIIMRRRVEDRESVEANLDALWNKRKELLDELYKV